MQRNLAKNWIDAKKEVVVSAHSFVNEALYPQHHDFHEFTYIIKGSLFFESAQHRLKLTEGDLIFVAANAWHAKKAMGECQHINIGFLSGVLDDLFAYLKEEEIKTNLLELMIKAPIHLSVVERKSFIAEVDKLSFLPIAKNHLLKVSLRIFLFQLISTYYMPLLMQPSQYDQNIPQWLRDLARQFDMQRQNLAIGVDYFYDRSFISKSHFCREFKRYMGMTPTDYVNGLRLNYAANLLILGSQSILEICNEAGFSSASHFYHLFQQKYGITPKKFRTTYKGQLFNQYIKQYIKDPLY